MSFRLHGAGCNFLVAVCVGGPPALLPGVRWPLAAVWPASAVPSRVCGGLFWLDPRLASLALMLWCAVVRRVAPRRALVCRSVPHRIVSCCGVLCFAVPCHGAWHCGALRCGVPCCLVLCRGGSVEVSLACVVVRIAGWSVAGWWPEGAVTCGLLAWSVLWGSGCAARAGGSDTCPWGCPPWGPVPWSRVLWGSRPLALGAVAVPLSSSGACEVALVVAGVVAWRCGRDGGLRAVFPAASSVGVAHSPRVGVPSIPCVVSDGWWACAGVIHTASDSCFGGVC